MAADGVGRNAPCPCGSGRKFKKCCLNRDSTVSAVPPDIAPADLVRRRAEAFAAGDFAFIYDTYHPDANFRAQFPNRQAYISLGKKSLQRDFHIDQCQILKEEVGTEEARVLFYLDTRFRGEQEETFELSRFLRTDSGWRYHSSQKLSRAEFSGSLEEIDWPDFAKVKDKVFF